MITLFYKMYTYAPKATCVSVISSLASIFAFIGAIACIYVVSGPVLNWVLAVLLFALAVFLFVYCSRKLPDKLSEKESEKNITTRARYALIYCKEHPEAYETLVAQNKDFAGKYMRNETGKIVKRK